MDGGASVVFHCWKPSEVIIAALLGFFYYQESNNCWNLDYIVITRLFPNRSQELKGGKG